MRTVAEIQADIDNIDNSPADAYYCMCGSHIDSHGMSDNHSPVSQQSWLMGKLQEELIEAKRCAP